MKFLAWGQLAQCLDAFPGPCTRREDTSAFPPYSNMALPQVCAEMGPGLNKGV